MEWLINYGYLGLFIGSFFAATIVPFSSEIVLTAVLEAGADPAIAIIIATAGNWIGGMTTYWIGWLGKWEWIEKRFKISRERLERQKSKIDKYGSLLAFLTWLPGIGDVMSVALGFYRADRLKTASFMLIGRFVRFAIWTAIYLWVRPML